MGPSKDIVLAEKRNFAHLSRGALAIQLTEG